MIRQDIVPRAALCLDRGRDAGCPAPPAQIRTRGTTPYGSYRRSDAQTHAWRIRSSPLNGCAQSCAWLPVVCPEFPLVIGLPYSVSAT